MHLRVAIVTPLYNQGCLVQPVLDALLAQVPPADCDVDIVAVDDGSNDGSTGAIQAQLGRTGKLVYLQTNQGRCAARNAGADAASDADLLIFVDGDCIAEPGLVSAHVAAIRAGADVSFGDVVTPGDSFWAALQRDVSERRSRQFHSGNPWLLTAANFAIRRPAFTLVGGFDLAFNRHGFEDRDLFLRLASTGARQSFTRRAAVRHAAEISLKSVALKLGDAGFHAAHLFRSRHPRAYAKLAFSRLDCAIRPWLHLVDRIAWPTARRMATGPSPRYLASRILPFVAKAFLVRAIYGLWFLHGTAERARLGSRRSAR